MSQLLHGDCFEFMNNIDDKSIDMVLCDLPYNTTACKWDQKPIDLDLLWKHYKRIIKDHGAIVLTATQPFSSKLVMSNLDMFKYEWIWDKKIPSGMSYARYRPMRQHEIVLIFGHNTLNYYPNIEFRNKSIKGGGMTKGETTKNQKLTALKKRYDTKNPTTIIKFDKIRNNSIHPTQKPVKLFEYLIKTYTKEGDIVLDNCSGSGTTAIACINTDRQYICIEKDDDYYRISKERIEQHVKDTITNTLEDLL